MKTLQIISSIYREDGGTAAFAANFCTSLANTGLGTTLITGKKEGCELLPISPSVDHRFAKFGSTKLSQFLGASDFSEKVSLYLQEIEEAAVVHVHGLWLWSNHLSLKVAVKRGVPVVVSPHGMLDTWDISHHRARKRLAMWLYQKKDLLKVSVLHACSMVEVTTIQSYKLGIPVACIPIGVDVPEDISCPPVAPEFLNPNKKTALFLSRIHPKKGLKLLIECWSQLQPENWQLIIAGIDNDGYLEEMLKLISRLGMQNHIKYVGPVFGDAKDQLYRSSDLFLLPTHSENFGIVVPEALSYGVPVLTTTGTPWVDELVEFDCGWCCGPTMNSLKPVLTKALATEKNTLVEMGHRGREMVKLNYSWPAIGQKTHCLYDWLLGKAPQPDFIYR